jgi:hypothetical protein
MNKHQSRLVMMVFGALLFLSGGAWGTPGARDAALEELLRSRLEGMRATGLPCAGNSEIINILFILKNPVNPVYLRSANHPTPLKNGQD